MESFTWKRKLFFDEISDTPMIIPAFQKKNLVSYLKNLVKNSNNCKIVQNDVIFTKIGWRQIQISQNRLASRFRLKIKIQTMNQGQGQDHDFVSD